MGNYSHPHRWPFILLLLPLWVVPAREGETQQSFEEQVEARVLAQANDFRAKHGLQPLERNPRLIDAARSFARYMASSGRLEHDADGRTPAARAKQRGYDYCIIAENIAYEYSSRGYAAEALARNFVQGWIESPTHRANLLELHVTQTGVGIAGSRKSGEYYAVQMLGRPESERVKFRITNRTGRTVRYAYRNRTVALPPKHTRTHQSCVPGDLGILPAGEQPTTLRPRNGDRFAIVEASPGVIVFKEE